MAVKVLGAMGTGTSPGLDDEFPDAATSKGHPLYESLQKVSGVLFVCVALRMGQHVVLGRHLVPCTAPCLGHERSPLPQLCAVLPF